jgi:hypothetical protein
MRIVWERRGAYRASLKEKTHLQDLGADGRVILKWMLNQLGGYGLD